MSTRPSDSPKPPSSDSLGVLCVGASGSFARPDAATTPSLSPRGCSHAKLPKPAEYWQCVRDHRAPNQTPLKVFCVEPPSRRGRAQGGRSEPSPAALPAVERAIELRATCCMNCWEQSGRQTPCASRSPAVLANDRVADAYRSFFDRRRVDGPVPITASPAAHCPRRTTRAEAVPRMRFVGPWAALRPAGWRDVRGQQRALSAGWPTVSVMLVMG